MIAPIVMPLITYFCRKMNAIIIGMLASMEKEGLMETRNALRALRSIEEEKLDGVRAIQRLIDVFERVTGVQVQR